MGDFAKKSHDRLGGEPTKYENGVDGQLGYWLQGDMMFHKDLADARGDNFRLRCMIRSRRIVLGGNYKEKIYGTLFCSSGKRMKTENRVFFQSEEEAIKLGFRPCGHCLPQKYKHWKASLA